MTLGARWYKYEFDTRLATDTPLFNTVYDGDPPDQIILDYEPADQSDDGVLYKFNTSYQITNDVMTYLTISEGYRIGNTNGLELCPEPQTTRQNICAQPDELEYKSDKTMNYEIGAHTTLARRSADRQRRHLLYRLARPAGVVGHAGRCCSRSSRTATARAPKDSKWRPTGARTTPRRARVLLLRERRADRRRQAT